MEYDYHGTWDGYTGHNAPLFASPEDDTPEKKAWNIVSIRIICGVEVVPKSSQIFTTMMQN